VRRRAIGYLEAVMAAAVLGIALAAGLTAYGAFAQGVAADREVTIATELAAQLAAEIRTRAFEDPVAPIFGPETGENDGTRLQFDDVDDYDGWSASPPKLRDGTAMTEFAGFAQQVSVTNDLARGLKVITITISKGGKKRAELVLARARHDADQ